MLTLRACGRHDLGDREWTVLEPLLPAGKKPGRPRKWSRTSRLHVVQLPLDCPVVAASRGWCSGDAVERDE